MARWIVLAIVILAALAGRLPAGADGVMLVQAGAFWMGRDDGPPDERPLHRVYVREFWIERHKVTNAEFAAFLNARGDRQHGARAPLRRRRSPTRGFIWCPRPSSTRRGLPTPASSTIPSSRCRGSAPATTALEGAPAADRGRVGEDGARRRQAALPVGTDDAGARPRRLRARLNATERVDARPDGASPYRVEDLLGNLREWTSTALRAYPYRADDGREPFTGAGRVVVRGASHDDPADSLHVSTRRSYDRRGAAAGHHHVGFRCATSEDLGGY